MKITNEDIISDIEKLGNIIPSIHGEDKSMTTKLSRHYNFFKRFNTISELDAPEPSLAMVFFTRPDMFLYSITNGSENDSNGVKVSATIMDLNMASLLSKNYRLYRFLDADVDTYTNFIPLMTSAFVETSIPDIGVEMGDSAANRYGMSAVVPKQVSLDSRGGTVSFTFNSDYDNNIYKLMSMIVRYQIGLMEGRVSSKIDNSLNNVIDYSMTAYGFLLSSDGKRIKHWFEIPGIYPSNTNDSLFKYRNEPSTDEPISVNFNVNLPIQYCDISTIMKFNTLMGFNPKDLEYVKKDMNIVNDSVAKEGYSSSYYTDKFFVVERRDDNYGDTYYELVSRPLNLQPVKSSNDAKVSNRAGESLPSKDDLSEIYRFIEETQKRNSSGQG